MPDLLPLLASQDPGYTPINNRPSLLVEVAWNAGYLTAAVDRVWTDVTDYVDLGSLSVERGRQDNEGQVGPSRLSLTFDNRDGRFTPEYASGAYYPKVKRGRPIRVSAVSVLGTTFILCVGYLDSVAVQWPGGSDAYATALISATSRMARLGKSGAFRSILEEEITQDSPRLLFPCGEAQGSTTAGNVAAGRAEVLTATQLGSGGTLTFGTNTGPVTDGLSAPAFTPVDRSNGLYLRGNVEADLIPAGAFALAVEAWFATTDSGGSDMFVATLTSNAINVSSKFEGIHIWVAGGVVRPSYLGEGGVGSYQPVGPSVADGAMHQAAVVMVLDDSTDTATIHSIVDGVVIGTSAPQAWPYLTPAGVPFFLTPKLLTAGAAPGPSTAAGVFNGTISHVAVYASATAVSDARFDAHYDAGTTGFEGESSDARIRRLARLAGIPTAEVVAETGLSTSIAHKDITGVDPVAAMEVVRLTEDGVLFDGKNGDLTFHARSHRYNSTSAFTLDCSTGVVEADFSPKTDDQGMLNDVKASRPLGVEIHAADQASIAENGYYRDDIEVLTTLDAEVQSRADWEVNRRGTPRTKAPEVKVSLAGCPPSLIDSLLAADIGTRFTLTNLPAQASVSTMDFFIEGISHEISAEDWTISFNTSRTEYANAGLWDSGLWDSAIWAY